MNVSDFFFELPAQCIAQNPLNERGSSRLLVLNKTNGAVLHKKVIDFPDLISDNSLVVFNNTRVRKARIQGACDSGKKIEFLLIETQNKEFTIWSALAKNSKKLKPETQFYFNDNISAKIKGCNNGVVMLEFSSPVTDGWLEKHGHIPLPPYIKRKDNSADSERYQTVYAKNTGSIAAPTAGLHFSAAVLDKLEKRKIETIFVTLHVGLGTFLPVRAKKIEEHKMHREFFFIDDKPALAFEAAKRDKRPVIAIGTTTLRALESAWNGSELRRGIGETALFIYGDYKFKTADMLFTNFHTPESTLLMLVSSFCGTKSNAEEGRKLLLSVYKNAINEGYRFFSYGDAMLITE
ncbi:MAG: tRNA preQ1(34) S-adenosylmethionine ribosyltransferase-isomerase QueA [Spirochaetaceae bacterium]|jgi:S-adenosylmethionine:tRNA ribosyltransferase-isomerase|nr:tRNA preQ1(34) S-adenosylmethionine ribosyltransferase-isomerase QueA [Spirochaetaceae bacterium]